MSTMKFAQDIIIRPVISEASMGRLDNKKYTFEVAKNATKPQIAAAIEEIFNVKVDSVNTINMKSKPRRHGVHFGHTSAWKKAIVTLTEGSKTIEFFDGMN